jgi:signal transduction histidine kinase
MPQELHAALLQAVVTGGTAAVCWYLYLRYRRRDLLWWSVAWSLYLLRIGAISAFLVHNDLAWLFAHQVLTGVTALGLLWAAITYSRLATWRPVYVLAALFPLIWSWVAIYELDSFMLAAVPAVAFLSLATFWTGWIFFRQWRRTGSRGAAMLAFVLFTWSLHHLDYPILRAMGSWNPWGYYLDIVFALAMGMGLFVLVLEELDSRTRDLGLLSTRMLNQHEEERRRLSLELHDQSAQVWAAVKMQLGMMRENAGADEAARLDRVLGLVDTGIRSIRSVTTNLRPPLLDDLGVAASLRALTQSFAEQSGLAIEFVAPTEVPRVSAEAGLALYRAVQEALSNVARHAGATRAEVHLQLVRNELVVSVTDDGHGFTQSANALAPDPSPPSPSSLGLKGMRERLTAVRGSVEVKSLQRGASVTVKVPVPA